ncbi:CBM35 domain-containing protein [Acidobacterium sp. S8]|uniref:alpha-galactosidase D n=1 Tax=Acidobacterium sp. S8 TaxID=1641854 RepID=UPI00131AFF2E|nr:CBM35 domain-containing protein [Acidobacterium sp. S8]
MNISLPIRKHKRFSQGRLIPRYLLPLFLAAGSLAHAQVNGAGQRPYLGWSTFSEQTINGSFLTQANITTQSDALAASGIQSHGFKYINIDSGWQGSFDANGRPIPNTTTFPDIKALIDHIHQNGQKAGIYWIPGVEQPAVQANSPILGTQYHIQDILTVPYTAGNAFGGSGTSPYHYKIDFTKPGAQEYMNSVVALFASWGVDFIKLDGVTPGSYSDGLSIDNRADVAAWSKAIALTGKPIWLTISWAIDQDYLSDFLPYQNARRIEDDIECEGRCGTLTDWQRIYQRFRDLPGWQNSASPSQGWNDLDSLDIGDGTLDGLTNDEKRTAVSLWAMANAPMYLGGDLTKIDAFGKSLVSNDEVIAVNQSGKPAKQALGGDLPVWVSSLGHNTYYVAVFNLTATPSVVHLPWNLLGVTGALQVRDLWNHRELGPSLLSFTTVLNGHDVKLLKVTTFGQAAPSPSTSYEAESAILGGSASIADCTPCSDGEKVGGLGLGANNTVTFNNVYVRRAGVYLMQVDSMTQGLRSYLYSVNGGPFKTLNSGGGSFFIPAATVIPVQLQKGMNSIQFGNPVSYPPDLDRIVISGNGDAPLPSATTYEAEVATLSGTVTGGFSNYASGLAKAGNIGGGAGNAVTFSNVTVPSSGTYLLEVDYATSGPRSFFLTINDGNAQELALNGSTFDEPTYTVLQIQLHAGVNTLRFDNSTGYAPDLDRIVVAPIIAGSSF